MISVIDATPVRVPCSENRDVDIVKERSQSVAKKRVVRAARPKLDARVKLAAQSREIRFGQSGHLVTPAVVSEFKDPFFMAVQDDLGQVVRRYECHPQFGHRAGLHELACLIELLDEQKELRVVALLITRQDLALAVWLLGHQPREPTSLLYELRQSGRAEVGPQSSSSPQEHQSRRAREPPWRRLVCRPGLPVSTI
jgi:hypothetical protein